MPIKFCRLAFFVPLQVRQNTSAIKQSSNREKKARSINQPRRSVYETGRKSMLLGGEFCTKSSATILHQNTKNSPESLITNILLMWTEQQIYSIKS